MTFIQFGVVVKFTFQAAPFFRALSCFLKSVIRPLSLEISSFFASIYLLRRLSSSLLVSDISTVGRSDYKVSFSFSRWRRLFKISFNFTEINWYSINFTLKSSNWLSCYFKRPSLSFLSISSSFRVNLFYSM